MTNEICANCRNTEKAHKERTPSLERYLKLYTQNPLCKKFKPQSPDEPATDRSPPISVKTVERRRDTQNQNQVGQDVGSNQLPIQSDKLMNPIANSNGIFDVSDLEEVKDIVREKHDNNFGATSPWEFDYIVEQTSLLISQRIKAEVVLAINEAKVISENSYGNDDGTDEILLTKYLIDKEELKVRLGIK
ncbi:MAG: hypothetical protein AAB706_00600 [Patescibacteria group bacterium]